MSELNTRNEILAEEPYDRSSFFKKFWDFLFGSTVGVSSASAITAAVAPTSAFATPSAVIGSTIGNVASSTILPGIAKGALAVGTTTLGALPAAPIVIAASAVAAYKTIDYTIKTDASRFDKKYKKILEDQEINQYIRALDHFLFRIKESMRGMSKFNKLTNLTTQDNYCKLYLKVSRKKPIFDGLFKEFLKQQLESKDSNAAQKFIEFSKYNVGFSNTLAKRQEVEYKYNAWQFRDKEKNELRDELCKKALKYYEQYIGVLEMAIFLYKLVHYKYSVFLLNKRCISKDSKNANARSSIKYFDTQRWKNAVAESQKDVDNRYISGFNKFLKDIKTKGEEILEKPGYSDIKEMVKGEGIGIYQLNIDNKEDCKKIAGSAWIDGYVELVLNKYHRMPDIALLERTSGETSAFKIKALRDFDKLKSCPKNEAKNYNEKQTEKSTFFTDNTIKDMRSFIDGFKDISVPSGKNDHIGIMGIRKQQIYIMDYLGEIIDSLVEWVQIIPDKTDINKIEELNKQKKANRFNYSSMKLNELVQTFVFIEKYIDESHFKQYINVFTEIIYGKDIDFKSFNIHKQADGELVYNDKQYFDNKGQPIKRMGLIQLDIEINKVLSAYGNASKEDTDRVLNKYYIECHGGIVDDKPWAKSWQDKYLPDFLSYKNSKKQALTEIEDFKEQIKKVEYSTTGTTYHTKMPDPNAKVLPLFELYTKDDDGKYILSKYNQTTNPVPIDDKNKYYKKIGMNHVEYDRKEEIKNTTTSLFRGSLFQPSPYTSSSFLSSPYTSSVSTSEPPLDVKQFYLNVEAVVKSFYEKIKDIKLNNNLNLPIKYKNTFEIWNIIDALYLLIGEEKEKFSNTNQDFLINNELKLVENDRKIVGEIVSKYTNLIDFNKNKNARDVRIYTFVYNDDYSQIYSKYNIANQFLEKWFKDLILNSTFKEDLDKDIIRYYVILAKDPNNYNIFDSKEIIPNYDNDKRKIENRYAEMKILWKRYIDLLNKYINKKWIKLPEDEIKQPWKKLLKYYKNFVIEDAKQYAIKYNETYNSFSKAAGLKEIINLINPNIERNLSRGIDIDYIMNTKLDIEKETYIISFINNKDASIRYTDFRFGMTQWYPGLVNVSDKCVVKEKQDTLNTEYSKKEPLSATLNKSKAYYALFALTNQQAPREIANDQNSKKIYDAFKSCLKESIEKVASNNTNKDPKIVADTLINILKTVDSDTQGITNTNIVMQFKIKQPQPQPQQQQNQPQQQNKQNQPQQNTPKIKLKPKPPS